MASLYQQNPGQMPAPPSYRPTMPSQQDIQQRMAKARGRFGQSGLRMRQGRTTARRGGI